MRSIHTVIFGVLLVSATVRAQETLIVADEFHAMQVLASQLEADTKAKTVIMGQTEIPESLSTYNSVLVYIHGELSPAAEHKFIQYANDGGNLIVLHHTISSRKRENKDWFNFLHVELPNKPYPGGGYKYFAPVTFEIVNLAPLSPTTTRGVHFDEKVSFTSGDGSEEMLPGTSFHDTEVYLNHVLSADHKVLLGVKYTDPTLRKTYMQATAGWWMPAGKGTVFYFMMGHRAEDFNNPAYRHMLDNAVEGLK